jgi:hypothetical protein
MEAFSDTNLVRLCGKIAGRPLYSHTSRGQDFYAMPLEVRRLSGAEDRLNLILRRELLERTELREEERLLVTGQLRSFNSHREEGPRLVLTVFVRELAFSEEEEQNLVRLRGALCREPRLRRTPLGREIADLMLAVNRPYGRSDYLPCICWGALARRAALWRTGQRLRLEGRLQSRDYLKITDSGPEKRTAFEVSAMELEEDPSDTSFVESLDWGG